MHLNDGKQKWNFHDRKAIFSAVTVWKSQHPHITMINNKFNNFKRFIVIWFRRGTPFESKIAFDICSSNKFDTTLADLSSLPMQIQSRSNIEHYSFDERQQREWESLLKHENKFWNMCFVAKQYSVYTYNTDTDTAIAVLLHLYSTYGRLKYCQW